MANLILITGGSGKLGTCLRAHLEGIHSFVAPSRDELGVARLADCVDAADRYRPKIVIHCAAFANTVQAEVKRSLCWRVNVEGTRNMLKAFQNSRFVFISTDYVFDGKRGNYTEWETASPINFYGRSKKVAEDLVRCSHSNSLIVRAPFRHGPPWPYDNAFEDQWTSARFTNEVAGDIISAALRESLVGTIHIGGMRRSIYEMAASVNPNVRRSSIRFLNVKLPEDVSLDSSLWDGIKDFELSRQEPVCLR